MLSVFSVVKKTLVLLTLLLAAFLRFHRLGGQSFWNDEGNSARLAERSVGLILAGAAGDIHPPGYYLLLAAWSAAVGHSEFALRGLSVLAGIVLVAVVYRLGKQYFDEPAALASAFFAAIHPALIYYSQEARMYELVAALAAAAFLAMTQWLVASRNSKLQIHHSSFIVHHSSFIVLITALGLYTHYSFAFVLIALNLTALGGMLAHRARATPAAPRPTPLASRIVLWLLLQLLALALFAPWLPTAVHQLATWPSAREYHSFADSLLDVGRWLTLGPTADASSAWAALPGAAILIGLGLRRGGQTITPLLWLLIPTGLTLGFGLFSPAFAKFLIIAVPALCLLMGNGLAALRKSQFTIRNSQLAIHPSLLILLTSALAAALLLVPTALSLNNLYFNPAFARADYRGMAAALDSIAKPGDAILLNAPNQWEVFTYYHRDTSNVFPVARTRPLDVPAQTAELERIAATHDRLFVLYWGDAQSDPDRVIETWLNAHTFKAYDQWHGDVRLAAYAVPRAAAQSQHTVNVTFGDQIALVGYALNQSAFAPGDILQLTLFWRTEQPIDTRYKVFVHLVGDPSQPPLAQHDGEPGGGLALTTAWQPGLMAPDNHGVYLPLDLPFGDYTLVVGLYRLDDGARLTTDNGADNLTLTAVTIR